MVCTYVKENELGSQHFESFVLNENAPSSTERYDHNKESAQHRGVSNDELLLLLDLF